MSRYWPEIKDASTAKDAVYGAAAVSAFIAGITALLAVLSLVYKKPILGLDGLALVDAGVFGLVAWRIYKMSRAWAVIGLVLYLLGVGERLLNRPSIAFNVAFVIVVTGIALAFIGGVRGAFAFHRYKKEEGQPQVAG
jgi:hypothetical protein